jgi:aspartyl-tRNA synthetase
MYAFVQSPQQDTQMLMVEAVERFCSLARCFRNDDLQADRQPEFAQIDLEMSSLGREDVDSLAEKMLKNIWKATLNITIGTPFARIAF